MIPQSGRDLLAVVECKASEALAGEGRTGSLVADRATNAPAPLLQTPRKDPGAVAEAKTEEASRA